MKTKDNHEPGTGVRGERLSPLPNSPEDFPSSPIDLGRTYGTDYQRHYKSMMCDSPPEELAAGVAERERSGVMGMVGRTHAPRTPLPCATAIKRPRAGARTTSSATSQGAKYHRSPASYQRNAPRRARRAS